VNHDRNIYVDMAGHSLWAHFQPEGCHHASRIEDHVSKVQQLRFLGQLWQQGLADRVEKGESVTFRLLIIKPWSDLSALIERHQVSQSDEGEQQRKARTDGYATLYVVWHLIKNRPRVDAVVHILNPVTHTMTYSFCKIGTRVSVGQYNYEGRSLGEPCIEIGALGKPGRHFVNAFLGFFKSGAEAIAVHLERELRFGDGSEVKGYEEFQKWVDEQMGISSG
jgi:hypothetical protein